jgi:Uma2 family endonuclease
MAEIALQPKRWTIDEYHQLIETGLLGDTHVELLNGQIIEMPPENPPHAYQSQEADRYLARLLEPHAYIRQAKPITLPNNSEPEPDIAVVRPPGNLYRHRHPYPEDIFFLIEYSDSTLNHDQSVKLAVYATAGISEYWIVDVKRNRLIAYRYPQGAEYTSITEQDSGMIHAISFPTIQIDVLKIINP